MILSEIVNLILQIIDKMSEKLSIAYFRKLLAKNEAELKNFCGDWEKCSKETVIPETVCDEIRTTIGLTNLLLQQKLKQFAGLIDDSEFKRGEKEITCVDLQGFWDMVYNEVEKIQKRFQNLEKCRENSWVFVEESIVRKEPKKVNKLTMASAVKITANSKERALAARQRLAEAKLKMKAQMIKKSENSANVQILDSLNEDLQQLKVAQKNQGVSGSSTESKSGGEVRSPLKRTLKNIRNLNIPEQEDLSDKSETPSKKFASRETTKVHNKQKALEKENIVKSNEAQKVLKKKN